MWIFILVLILILSARYYYGGSEFYVYHGSYKKIKQLEPYQKHCINGESAVFATPSYIDAVIFSAGWTDANFSFGRVNNQIYLTERYPGAMTKFDKTGYIHYLDPKDFHRDARLPPSELISYNPVKPIKCVKVNVRKEIEKSNVKIITNKQLLAGVKKNKPVLIKRKIKTMYVPIDMHWRPNIPDTVYFRDPYSGVNAPGGSKVIINNLDCYDCVLHEYDCDEKYLVIPSAPVFHESAKTSQLEYDKYVKNMKKIYKNYKIIKI